MNWLALMVLGAILVSISPRPALAQRVPLDKVLERYDSLEADNIVWGNESDDERWVGVMDPPYFTTNPNEVEVLEFVRYTSRAWQRSEPMTRTWRASLPARVSLLRLPKGTWGNVNNMYRDHWLVHQRVYFAGLMLGREAEVHDAIIEMNRRGSIPRLDSERQVPEIARRLGIEPRVFGRWYHHPEVAFLARMASKTDRDRAWALRILGKDGPMWALYPAFVVNGKHVVDASLLEDPADVYRVANWLIRRELESGRAHEGPTNDMEFAEWMAPRSGEIFKRVWLRRAPTWFGVFNHARREIWSLSTEGKVQQIQRLSGDGDDSFFENFDENGNAVRGHPWRVGRQYVSFEGEHGPQRYGAFLLTDYLSAPDTHWVSLPFKERDAAMAFSSDGKVEARNDNGSMFGSWWLEAGDLNVSFGELGAQSWPWQEVAERVGFNVPQRSLTPWLFEEGRDSGEEAMHRPVATPRLSSRGSEDRGR